MIELIGSFGTFFLCICSVPQAVQCFKQKHAKGVNPITNLLWLFGIILMLIYLLKTSLPLIILCNYIFNLLVASVIEFYILFPKNDK